MEYLAQFKVNVRKIDENKKIARIYIEYREFDLVYSELHEIIVVRNADDIAVIESDVYDSQDYIDCYKLRDRKDFDKIDEKIDVDDINAVLDFLIVEKLKEIKLNNEDEELNKKIDRKINTIERKLYHKFS